MLTSVYRGFGVTSRRSYVKVDSDPATTGARGPFRSVHAALVVDNNGSTRLVLLVMIHFALYSQLLLNTVIDVPVAQVVQVIVVPVVVQRPIPIVQTVCRTIEFPQFFFDKEIDVPVVQVVRFPQVPSWRRQTCSHGCTS